MKGRFTKAVLVVAGMLLLAPAAGSAQTIFSDNFDAQPDWQSKQYTYLNGGGISWGTPTYAGTCSTDCPPANWTAYRASQSLWSPNARDTYLINAEGARGGSGKGLTYNVESTGNWGTWAGGGLDKYLGKTGYQELYVRFYIKETPEFCWGSSALNLNAMGKLLRITALRRDPTVNPNLFNPEQYPSPDTSPTLIGNAYRRFQPNYTIPAQFNAEERYAPNYEYGPSTTFPAQFPNDSTTGGAGYCGDNKWHAYEYYVKMNSALGVADGVYRTWLDGKLVSEKTNVPWVKAGTDSNGTPMSLATGWNWVMIADNIDSTAYPVSAKVEMARYLDDVVISTHYSGPPAMPASVTAAPGAGTIDVKWAAGSNGASYTVDGYHIYYGTDPANLDKLLTVGNVTQAQLTELAAGKYYVSVSGFNKANSGFNENEGLRSAAVAASVTSATSTASADSIAPAVSISAPASGATVSGTVTVNMTATDNVGVSKVELYLNGAIYGVIGSAPYSISWNTASSANGSYTLTAKAYDAAGNVAQSAPIALSVNNSTADTTAPLVTSFTMPATASSVTVPVSTFTASDNKAVAGYLITESSTKPTATAAGWSASAPASFTFAGSGSRTAYAWSKDAAGNVSVAKSAGVTISVPTTAPGTADATAPSVTITSPAYGSTVSGTVSVVAGASDNVGVSKVEFYVNGTLKATSAAAPYTFSWNTTGYANGAYSVSAKAYDAAGNVGSYPGVTLFVSNSTSTSSTTTTATATADSTKPTVTITSPAYGSTVRGTVSVVASASDNVGVSKVEFYVNGSLKATSTAAPYTFSWNTTGYANGAYSVSAKAYDKAGNIGSYPGVTLYVANDTTAPVISMSAPAGSTVTGTYVTFSASATDNVGVTKMELYLDNSLKYATSASSFKTVQSLSVGTHAVVVKAYDAAKNVKTFSKSITRTY